MLNRERGHPGNRRTGSAQGGTRECRPGVHRFWLAHRRGGGDLIIKDRRHISEDGIVLPIIAINKLTGEVETSPEIVTRGF